MPATGGGNPELMPPASMLPDILVTLNQEGVFTYISRAFSSVTGWSPEDWVGKSFVNLIHADDLALTHDRFSSILNGKLIPLTQVRMLTRSGEYRTVEANGSPTVKDGTITGVVALIRDVTDRVRGEEAQDRDRQRSMFALSPLPSWLVDRQTLRLLEVNEAFTRTLGYTRQELLNTTVERLLVEDDALTYRSRVPPETFTGVTDEVWRYRKKDGTTITLRITARHFLFQGRPVRLVVGRDITEARQRNTAIRSDSERYSTLYSKVPLLVSTYDPRGRCTSINPEFERVTGWTMEDMVGRQGRDFVHPDELEKTIQGLMLALEGKPMPLQQFRMRSKTGEYVMLETLTVPIMRGNELEEILCLAQDITERKRLEDDLRFQSAVLKSIHGAVIGYDVSGAINYWNEGATELFGWTAQEMLGHSITTLWRMSHEQLSKVIAETAAGKTHFGIVERTHKDGHRLWVDVGRSAIKDDAGNVIGILSVCQDVTERQTWLHMARPLSTPVLRVDERILLVPLIGTIDKERVEQLAGQVLNIGKDWQARCVILDMTGVARVLEEARDLLAQAVGAAEQLGARVIVSGMSQRVAGILATLDVPLDKVTVSATLLEALHVARGITGPQGRGDTRLS